MARFQFSNKKDKISDEEINSRMNFDQFLAARPAPAKPFRKLWKAAGITAAAAAVVTVSYLAFSSDNNSGSNSTYVPVVQPPVPYLQLKPSSFEINPAADTLLVSAKGSEIIVPKGTFVYNNGKPATGNIELRYREFHDQIEIMLSGIPMRYDTAGQKLILESAGMFEITAFQNSEPLQIAPGKEITVRMISPTPENNFHIYYLDTLNRRWQYIAENTRENNTCSEPIFLLNKEMEKKYNTFAASIIPQPVKPVVASPSAVTFSIDYVKSEFPELAAFDGIKFEPLPGEKQFSEKLATRTWEDVNVERSDEAGKYLITLSTENETYTFNAKAVVDGKNHAQAIAEFEKRDKIYQQGLTARTNRLNALRDSMFTLNENMVSRSASVNYNDKFNAYLTGDYTKVSKDQLVYRTLKVGRLGVWNSDRPRNFFDNFMDKVKANMSVALFTVIFKNKLKQKIRLKTAFLVKNDVNTIYPVFPGEFEKNFPYLPGEIDMIMGITEDDKICYCKGNDLEKAIANGQQLEFVMQLPAEKVNTVDQLKSFLKN
ncbi:MAG: hypothetical protein MUC87_10105 [Bacteroidia bacterium]|jgi:hypothetical protein|nr:hypothetical protein [Bacteroidia bacterium]